MTWNEYEDAVLNYLIAKFSGSKVTKNVKIKGSFSETLRQIDILVETQISDFYIPLVVECKNWETKLDVADIGSFIDKLKDVGISKGLMVSKCGYTKAAYQRVKNENDINLFILDFENMSEFQGFWANPYRGNLGAFLSAPTGWVADYNLTQEEMTYIGLCLLYPMGLTKQEAFENKQVMFFQIYPVPILTSFDINELIKEQNDAVLIKDKKAKINLWQENSNQGLISYREIYYDKDNYMEYTAYVQTERFYAICIVTSKKEDSKEYLSKLKYVMNNIHFIVLDGVDPTNSHNAWKNLLKFKQ